MFSWPTKCCMIYFLNAPISSHAMLFLDILLFSQTVLFTVPCICCSDGWWFWLWFLISEFKNFCFPFARCWLCDHGKVRDGPLSVVSLSLTPRSVWFLLLQELCAALPTPVSLWSCNLWANVAAAHCSAQVRKGKEPTGLPALNIVIKVIILFS